MKKNLIGIFATILATFAFFTGVQADVVVNNAPVIHLIGSNPSNIVLGEALPDLGVWVYDAEDGDITRNLIVTSEAIDPDKGIYVLTYNAVDSMGVPALSIQRTVNFVSSTTFVPSENVVVEPEPVVLVDKNVPAPVVETEVPVPDEISYVELSDEEDIVVADIESSDIESSDIESKEPSRLVAMAIATMPKTKSDTVTGIFLFIIILALIYIGSNIIVNSKDTSGMDEKSLRHKKIQYFIFGDIIALICAYLLGLAYLFLPLGGLLVILVIWFVLYTQDMKTPTEVNKGTPVKQVFPKSK